MLVKLATILFLAVWRAVEAEINYNWSRHATGR
jgi:hypothetical protein